MELMPDDARSPARVPLRSLREARRAAQVMDVLPPSRIPISPFAAPSQGVRHEPSLMHC